MAANSVNKTQDDKNMRILRQLSSEPDNKKCMDCGIKGTVYVCSNFNTFICTACSGLHREFSHRVKSISMTTFKPEEIKNLQAGGNAVARKKYLARWNPEDFPEPDPSDSGRVKAFMKLKYIDKRWYSETGAGPGAGAGAGAGAGEGHAQNYHNNHHPQAHAPPSTSTKPKASDSYPQPVPLTTILGNDIPPLHINGANKHPISAHPQHQPASAQANSAQNLVDWNAKAPAPPSKASSDLDDLLSMPSSDQQQAYQMQLQQQQHQNMYQQQQHLVMSQFGGPPAGGGAWGGGPQHTQAFFSPYGAPQGGFGQPQQQTGFFGAGGSGGVQTPPNFFAPPPAQPANPYASNGSISPAFGQPAAAVNPYGLSPSPTPLSQPNAFGGLSPSIAQPGFGATLSPAQPNAFGVAHAHAHSQQQPPPNAFGGSPALHALHAGGGPGGPGGPFAHSNNAFGGQPTLTAAPTPAQPAADKFDIFASLSPLNAAKPAPSPSFPSANPTSSFPAVNPPSSHPSSHSNPNPFSDPFGAPSQPSHSQPVHAHAQPGHLQPPAQNHMNMNSDPFGGFGPATTSPSLTSKPAPNASVNHSDPFGGFGATPSPSLTSQPAPSASNDPFGFGAPTPQQSANNHNNNSSNANPFGDNFFGAPSAQQPPAQPSSSAFSPFNANPFGQQQQQQQQPQPPHQQQPKQVDPWGSSNANPFF